MKINGVSIEDEYGAYLLGTPKISPAPITPNILTYKNGSNFITLGRTIGLKKIECNIAFYRYAEGLDYGESYYWRQYQRSWFRSALTKNVSIDFETDPAVNGESKYYCAYETDAELESEHENAVVSKFVFTGIQYEDLVTETGNKVYCYSFIPETDCRISATVSAYAPSHVIQGVNFGYMFTGTRLVVDGINKRILGNDKDIHADFIKFPTLKPGENTLNIDTTVFSNIKVEYYPTFL